MRGSPIRTVVQQNYSNLHLVEHVIVRAGVTITDHTTTEVSDVKMGGIGVNLKLTVAVAMVVALAGCGSNPSPAPAPPSPDQQLLTKAHMEEWPAPDAELIPLAHQQCPTEPPRSGSTDLAVNLLVIKGPWTSAQAKSFVYTARQLYCPDKVGQ